MENKESELKIIFAGTPEFSSVILDGIIGGSHKPALVVTTPDKPVGREGVITESAVKVLAKKYDIPVLQPEEIKTLIYELKAIKPDLIVVTAYGQILPKEILEIPKYGCINLHPSLLPRWRGPSPIQYTILNGDKKTGVTVILMDEEIDHGPILSQREIMIAEDETGKTLCQKLAVLGARLLLETISQLERGLAKTQPQNQQGVTYSRILNREDGKINWKKTAEGIERQVRAFELWPESFTLWQSRGKLLRIKILKVRVLKSKGSIAYPIGKVLFFPENKLCVQCGRGILSGAGDFLVIEELQLEGKNEITSEEFLRGYPYFINSILK